MAQRAAAAALVGEGRSTKNAVARERGRRCCGRIPAQSPGAAEVLCLLSRESGPAALAIGRAFLRFIIRDVVKFAKSNPKFGSRAIAGGGWADVDPGGGGKSAGAGGGESAAKLSKNVAVYEPRFHEELERERQLD